MPIIRTPDLFDDPFTRIPNHWVRDKRLSLASIGLITQLRSHKPGWTVSQDSLAKANNIGRDAMRTILTELMGCGYLRRSEERERNNRGQLAGYTYWTSEPSFDGTTADEPTTGEPTLGEPTTGEPTTAEPTHKKNILKEEQSKEEQSKESLRTSFDDFWDQYPLKTDKARARKAFERSLSKAGLEEILAGTTSYRDDPNRMEQFTKYPATWLNAESWNNGPMPFDARAEKQRDLLEQDRIKKEWGQL